MSSGGLERVADDNPYGTVVGVVASRFRTPNSAGAATTVPGVELYVRGRPPAVNSGSDGAPPV
jgi:hypothetical protein